MMRFDIITIFPHIFDSYLKESLLARAQKKKLIKIHIHNLRDYTSDQHKTVDDRPYGGGPGMVMMVEPIYKAVKSIKPKKKEAKIILLSPRGKKFNQKMAQEFAKTGQLILICGRYEGVDERVAKYLADEVVSIGDYVLSGGELPALVIIEAVSRLVPGVLGNKESLTEESFSSSLKDLDFPQYTRPAIFKPKRGKQWKVPEVLLSGNHQKIQEWRKRHKKRIT